MIPIVPGSIRSGLFWGLLFFSLFSTTYRYVTLIIRTFSSLIL